MTRGRKPKPHNLQVIEGNPGKRAMLSAPLNVESLYEEPPKALDGDIEAQEYWRSIMPKLVKHGLYTVLDQGMLVGTCISYGRMVRNHQITVGNKSDFYETDGEHGKMIRRHAASSIFSESWRDYRSGASEFGLSPVARKHLGNAAQLELLPEDNFSRFEKK